MKEYRETAVVEAPAEKVWEFLVSMQRADYLRWHRADHVDFKRSREATGAAGVGQKVTFTERLAGRAYRLHCVVSVSRPGTYVEFKPTGLLGLLRIGRGYFVIDDLGDGRSRVEAVVELGWRTRIVDRLIDRLVDADALLLHMRQEGEHIGAVARGEEPT